MSADINPRAPETSNSGRRLERRLTRRMLGHWQAACRTECKVPSLPDLAFGDNDDAKAGAFLIREDQRTSESVIVLSGDSLNALMRENCVGKAIQDVFPAGVLTQIIDAFERTLKHGIPVLEEGVFQESDGRDVRFRALFAPATSGRNDDRYVYGAFGMRQ